MDATHYSFYIDEEEDEISINLDKLKKCGVPCIARSTPHCCPARIDKDDSICSTGSGTSGNLNEADRGSDCFSHLQDRESLTEEGFVGGAANAVTQLITAFNETCTLAAAPSRDDEIATQDPSLSAGNCQEDQPGITEDTKLCVNNGVKALPDVLEETSLNGGGINVSPCIAMKCEALTSITDATAQPSGIASEMSSDMQITPLSSDTAMDSAKVATEQSCQTSFCFLPSMWKPPVTPVNRFVQKQRSATSSVGLAENVKEAQGSSASVKTRVPVRSAKLFRTPSSEKGVSKMLTPFEKSPARRGKMKTSPWTVESPVAKYIHENPVPPLVQAVKPQKQASAKALSGIQLVTRAEFHHPVSSSSCLIGAKKYQSSNKGLPLKVAPNKFTPSKPFVMKHTASDASSTSTKDIDASLVHVLPARRMHHY
ncbi:uncharacterized protein LOC135374355 isoform X2 [Ornithodoros turicata]|uniref:uncharacterized protein LOC135374355 isoform X2 n=1 Tax=Ornithodoros turicata TaxID=34597 RepID=UPI003138E7DE